jgi:hypothetical protein
LVTTTSATSCHSKFNNMIISFVRKVWTLK